MFPQSFRRKSQMGLVLRYVKCSVIEMFVFQIHPSSVRTTQQLIVMVKMNVTFHGAVSCLIDYSYETEFCQYM